MFRGSTDQLPHQPTSSPRGIQSRSDPLLSALLRNPLQQRGWGPLLAIDRSTPVPQAGASGPQILLPALGIPSAQLAAQLHCASTGTDPD